MLNYLEDKLGSKAYTEMVDAYQQAYRRSHTAIDENKTAREAANEMVNDTLFALFSSKEGMQDMIDWTSGAMPAQERKTFLETFKTILDDVIKALDHFLKTGSFNSAERAALEMEKDQATAMRQMVLDAMDVAIENRDKAAGAFEIVDKVAVEGRKEAVNSTEAARFSIKVGTQKHIDENFESYEKELITSQLFQKNNAQKKQTFVTKDGKIGVRNNRSIYIVDEMEDSDLPFLPVRVYDIDLNESNTTDTSMLMAAIEEDEIEGYGERSREAVTQSWSRWFGLRRQGDSIRIYDYENNRRNTRLYIGAEGRVLHSYFDSPRKRYNRGRNFEQRDSYQDNSSQLSYRKSVKVTDARNSFKEYGEASPYTDSLEEVEVVSTILSKANQALGGIKSVKESSLNRISRSVIKKYKSNVEARCPAH